MNSAIAPQVIILDTNVCLDLFFFRDPRWAVLFDSLKSGANRAITREDCRAEWQAVLAYPKLALDDEARKRCAAEFDALITCHAKLEPAPLRALLPTCSDRDDQKFLELAFDQRVSALITKDKALLKLARKTAKFGLFSILSPEAWHQTYGEQSDSIAAL